MKLKWDDFLTMLTIHLCVAAYFKSRDGTSWATSMVWINGVPRGRSTAGAFIVPLVTNQVTKIHQSTWLTKKKKISALSAKLQVARVGSPLVPQWFPTTPASPPQKKCGAVLLLLAFGSCSWCGGSTASMWGPRIPQHRGMGRNWKTCWWTPSFSVFLTQTKHVDQFDESCAGFSWTPNSWMHFC